MQKTRLMTAVAVFAAACVAVTALYYVFTSDTDVSVIWPYQDSAVFVPDDGSEPIEVTVPNEVRFDGVYIFSYSLEPDGDSASTVSFSAGAADVVLSMNGEEMFNGSTARSDALSGSTEILFYISSGEPSETLPLEARVRYYDPEFYIFPALASVNHMAHTQMSDAALVNGPAILAGIAGLSFLIIFALFLFGIYSSSPDFSLLYLGTATIIYCVDRLFATGAKDVYSAVGQVSSTAVYLVAPLALVYVFMNRRKKILGYFMMFTGLLSLAIIAANVLQYISVRAPAAMSNLRMISDAIYDGRFGNAVSLLSGYMILMCLASAMVSHISTISETYAEKSALESQNRTIVAGYKNMVTSVRKTAEVRHEWKHDLVTLSLLYEQGKIEEIGEYLRDKNSFISEADRVCFTDNFAFDTILNSVSSRAANEGVKFTAHVSVPSELGIREEDVCRLLLNMFDNAFNACAEIEKGRPKYIEFTAEMKNGFLAVNCTNSAPEASEKPEGDGISHGWGLKNMRAICRRYGSDLVVNRENGVFTAKTALQLNADGAAEGGN